jgi:hypothetical protein
MTTETLTIYENLSIKTFSSNKLDLHINSYLPFKSKRIIMVQFVFLFEDNSVFNGYAKVDNGSYKSSKFSHRKNEKIAQISGKYEDQIIWDSRLCHRTLLNVNRQYHAKLLATLGMWRIEPRTNICAFTSKSIYKKCSNLEKKVLSFSYMPLTNGYKRINAKTNYSLFKKKIFNYNF